MGVIQIRSTLDVDTGVTLDRPEPGPWGRSLLPDRAAHWMWLVATGCAAFVVILGVVVARANSVLWLDRFGNAHLYLHYIGTGLTLNSALNRSAGAISIAAVVLVVGCWALGSRRGAVLLALAPAVGVVISEVIKHFVVRHAGGQPLQGYPSGHETTAVALAAAAVVLLRPGGPLSDRLGAPWRTLGLLLAVAFPVGLGAALIALRWHQPTDVIGGAALGIASLAALAPTIDHIVDRTIRIRE